MLVVFFAAGALLLSLVDVEGGRRAARQAEMEDAAPGAGSIRAAASDEA
jgi:hypothetical protein